MFEDNKLRNRVEAKKNSRIRKTVWEKKIMKGIDTSIIIIILLILLILIAVIGFGFIHVSVGW